MSVVTRVYNMDGSSEKENSYLTQETKYFVTY